MRIRKVFVVALLPLIVWVAAGYVGRQVDGRTVYASEFGTLWPYGGYKSGFVRCFPRTVMGKKVPMITIRLGRVTYGLNDVAHYNFDFPSSDAVERKAGSNQIREGLGWLRREGASLCGNLVAGEEAGRMKEGRE